MKRRLFSQLRIFLFVAVLSCILPMANLSYAIPDGDLDGDGAVTISDALRALRITVGLVQPPTSQDLAQGDVAPQLGGLPDPDGSINISDALFILRKVVGLVNWPSDLSALLSGEQQVPPVITGASAGGTVSVDPLTKIISGGIVTRGITGIVAHIHDGAVGVNGPVVIPLTGGPSVWNVPANTVLTDAQLARLLAGGLYYNVHSAANPGGEIRGQITQQVRFASLSGANEVPPNASTASATAVLAMNPLTRQVSGFIESTGITGIAAHFHSGAAGVNGPVVVPLVETPIGSGLWTVPAGSVITAAQAALFNIGSLYYNVHSTLFPGGEIRGQIVPATLTVKTALLDGAQEVPPVTTAATGTGVAILNSVTLDVRGNVVTTGVFGTATQIQQAVTGANGPTIVPMTETVAGSGLWFIPGTTPPLTPAQATAFNAGGLYYNVLSLANPTGEIRGQINIIPAFPPNGTFKTGGGISTAAPL
ncbi:MAG: CHRD domain-containing protein [Desulfuromonadales bacterium]|nr:CHRD domain-containing protein [Desulfuromonadales bacterium]